MTARQARIFYLLVVCLFLLVMLPSLLSDGMFMDGLLYAAIAKNLAHGLGTFWSPHLSGGLFQQFYEHPPLAIGLQSLFFSVLGDSILVERIYSLTCFALTAWLVVLIWKEITGSLLYGWLPVLLWSLVSIVSWSYANNMLENTMGVFVVLAVWLIIRARKQNGIYGYVLSGLSLTLAMMSKGFVSLYIWALPFFIWLVWCQGSFVKMCLQTIILIAATVLPLVILYYAVPEAAHEMQVYFTHQVVGSLEHVVTVSNRFQIVWMFVQHSVVPLLLTVLILILQRKQLPVFGGATLRPAILFFMVVLSGILPIMISLKQRGFYISTVYPFLGLSLGLLVLPGVENLLKPFLERYFRMLKMIAYLMLAGALVTAFLQIGRIGRDQVLISDCYKVIGAVGADQVLGICPNTGADYSFQGYLARHGHIGLDYDKPQNHLWFLVKQPACSQFEASQYRKLEIGLEQYELYQKLSQ